MKLPEPENVTQRATCVQSYPVTSDALALILVPRSSVHETWTSKGSYDSFRVFFLLTSRKRLEILALVFSGLALWTSVLK